MKRIIVMVKNEVGVIADIARCLANADINMKTINTEATSEKGVIIITTDQDDLALQVLTREGFKAVTDEPLVIRLRDEPGALAKVAERFKTAQVNIQSLHILDRRSDHATVAISLSPEDRAKAESLLDGETIV